MASLLNLPAELRLQIYSYVVPATPLTIPSDQYHGLLYSCKAIRGELEPDLCKEIAACINGLAARIRNSGDEILYTSPITVSGWLNLTVSRPKKNNMFLRDDPFLGFKYFHFNTLTITFHNDAEGYEYYQGRPHTYQSAASNLAKEIGKWYRWEQYPAMKRWVLDWSAYPQLPQFNMDNGLYVYKRDAWQMRKWKSERGMLIGVCFYRRPRLMGKQEKTKQREIENED